jgi:hypothetical protein
MPDFLVIGGGGADTSDADMTAAELLEGKTGYGPEGKLTGEMPDNADADVEVSDLDGTTIPEGYYDGTGAAKLSAAEAAKVIAANIKSGVIILGVEGSYALGTPEKLINKTLTIPAPPTVSVSTAVAAI